MKLYIASFLLAALASSFVFFPRSPVNAKTQLVVPFIVQSPYGDWRQPWQDACEEATIAMVDAYYTGKKHTRKTAGAIIRQLIRWEIKEFGIYKDNRAVEISDIVNEYFPWRARVMENPTLDEIKAEIDADRPVIAPVYGRRLKNPHFADGGPDYHTVVISGYDDEKEEFIVQEPGTKRGLDWRYSYATVDDALHDYLPGNRTKFGKRVAIFTDKSF